MTVHGPEAYATLLVSDSYLPGAMVLGHSLRDNGTKRLLVALVTLDSVSGATVAELQNVYDQVIPVDRITNKSPANLYLMDRPDLNSTFTKIALWRQTQFSRIVYLDADIVALRAPEELFSRPSTFAAAPDVGWPDCFNSGVMALSPNMGDYYAFLALAQRGISFDGADQGLLNMHFTNYDRISFTYNCTPSANYQYVPAYRHFQSSISLVHFIGRDKPWLIGREAKGGNATYEELLGRWWAVYDKHYRYPTAAARSGQAPSNKRVVQDQVFGEQFVDYGYSSRPSAPLSQYGGYDGHHEESRHEQTHVEQPFLEASNPVESIERGQTEPTPTVEQRRFSAPIAEWNPIHQPPPVDSKPEAANFPTHTYHMSDDRNLFQAPKSYPEPPKDMWYEVPKAPTGEKPKPLFPWEENQAPPTRVFLEDPEPEPQADLAPSPPAEEEPELPLAVNTKTNQAANADSPATPTIQITPSEPFSSFSRTNAWDNITGIERYVQSMEARRKGKTPTTDSAHARTTSGDDVLSPTKEQRRPSFKLTDFPSASERPSLPVTPAPMTHKPTFWGEERDEEGQLPGAEGVPKQQDWDPLRKLEELQRRQSQVLESGPLSPPKDLPVRKLPGGAVLLPTSEETEFPLTSVSTGSTTSNSVAAGKKDGDSGVSFSAVKFSDDEAKSGAEEAIFE